jgi:hypothetical protein
VKNFIDLIDRKYISTPSSYNPMDLARKASFFTIDVITDLAFAKAFGNLTNDQDMYRYIESTEKMLQIMILMASIPPQHFYPDRMGGKAAVSQRQGHNRCRQIDRVSRLVATHTTS